MDRRTRRGYYLAQLAQRLSRWGWSLDTLLAGNDGGACEHPVDWPVGRLTRALAALSAVEAVIYIAGEIPDVGGAYRCEPENRRRGGADRSRHLYGDEPGREYAAYDLDWSSPAFERLEEWLETHGVDELERWVSAWLGVQVGVGVILYRDSLRSHVDIRRRPSYYEVQQ